jgi:hypothetical protein
MKIKQTSVKVGDQDKGLKLNEDTQTLLARAGSILILLGLLTLSLTRIGQFTGNQNALDQVL